MKPKGVLQAEETHTWFDRILDVTSYLSMAMIFFSTISLCVHVVTRYAYDRPLNWTIDLSCIILLYITMFAAAWVQRADGHVAIDFIFQFIGKRSQIKLHIFNSIVCVLCFAVVVVFGFKETLTAYQMGLIAGMPLEPPKWILTISIPIGFLLLLIQFLRRIRSLVKTLASAEQETGSPSAADATPFLR
ncbi:MAG: TRAP transporter small permease [Deltaproteobacteria bacterium]|nr:TRAP transporter small permease [Deltaproteobacteria bacterium]